MTAILIGIWFKTHVTSSWLVIWKQPSPSMPHTTLSGWATLAPIAAGMQNPMVPAPPEVSHFMGRSWGRKCADHI